MKKVTQEQFYEHIKNLEKTKGYDIICPCFCPKKGIYTSVFSDRHSRKIIGEAIQDLNTHEEEKYYIVENLKEEE